MYSAKINFFKPTVKEDNQDLKEKLGWLGSGVSGGSREGVEREEELGGTGGEEGEASKTPNICFCLCVSKGIWP